MDEEKKYLVIRKNKGKFCTIYGDDANIISSLFGYKILNNNKDNLEWLEIIRNGTKYTVRVEERIINKEIDNKIGMTGEITLRGNILPIGGLKEKCIGAYRNNIEKIIIPYDNESDLDEIPKEIKEKIKFVTVKNYEEVSKEVWK